jgi:hypothetical protein
MLNVGSSPRASGAGHALIIAILPQRAPRLRPAGCEPDPGEETASATASYAISPRTPELTFRERT